MPQDFCNSELNEARAFTYRVIQEYWSSVALQFTPAPPNLPHLPNSLRTEILDVPADKEAACAFAKNLPNEYSLQAAYDLTSKYASMLPSDLRSQYGIFYTPPSLTSHLLDIAGGQQLEWEDCKVLDPACGGGAFLAPVAMRKRQALHALNGAERILAISESLQGFEIDPFAAWMSQVLTELVLIEDVIRTGKRLRQITRVCDALRETQEANQYDLVIGNPPYGRTSLAKADREYYQRSLYGHANLYALFTDLALRAAKPGGVVALVTPASYLAGQYFKNLRRTIREVASPRQIDFVEKRNGAFAGVLQETVLSVHLKCVNGTTDKTNAANILKLRRDGSLSTQVTGQIYLPKQPDAPWIIPRTASAERLLNRIGSDAHHLSDYGYKVKTGPLVWNRHRQQLCQDKVHGAVPLVWAESVRASGTFEFSYSKRNHAPYFLPEPNQDWLLTRRSCVLLQRTTSKEQRKRLIAAVLPPKFIRDHGAAVIENHLNVVEPTKRGAAAIRPTTMAYLLNSPILDQIFRCLSGSVAVSAYEIEAMPLPEPKLIANMERDLIAGMDYGRFRKELQDYYEIAS
mgnify:FL=1